MKKIEQRQQPQYRTIPLAKRSFCKRTSGEVTNMNFEIPAPLKAEHEELHGDMRNFTVSWRSRQTPAGALAGRPKRRPRTLAPPPPKRNIHPSPPIPPTPT